MAIDCIILAAGAATRFGSCKVMADYEGHPMLARTILAAQTVAPERIVVVTGASHSQIKHYYESLVSPPFELAYCADWQSGLGHSLAYGVSQLPNKNAVLILLGDQPRVCAQDIKNLYHLWSNNSSQIACASFADTLGVPAIFPENFKPLLLQCTGDRGAKPILFSNARHVLAVSMPSAEFDVDTPADLTRDDAILYK